MIELNGVANIKILMDELVRNSPNDDKILVPAAKIYQQLDLLERYMVAVGVHLNEAEHSFDRIDTRPPYWHEVRENKDAYPLNRAKK